MKIIDCNEFSRRLGRKKYLPESQLADTKLARILNTFDLTALGVGSTLGAGVYVVAGQVAHDKAGPAVVLSFLIAGLASILAGLCYAEFGARIPRAGSAYIYSYVAVGELVAYIIAWNLILEYVIGAASVARAWSEYLDSLTMNVMSKFMTKHLQMNIRGLASYPDFVAFGLCLILAVILALGVKESAIVTKLFTVVNLLTVSYIIIAGSFNIHFENWTTEEKEIPDPVHNGKGGFFPFGFGGTLAGAATCFYAFVGFDVIATTGEEAIEPQRTIPRAIVISLLISTFVYCSVSAIITLMVPYYLITGNAPIPGIFTSLNWRISAWIIAIGAFSGLSASILGVMFPMPRIIYALACDGLLFPFLANVNQKFKTPFIATILSGLLSGIMAMLFSLSELVEMMSIGTLLAYTLVSTSVIILRFTNNPFERSTEEPEVISLNSQLVVRIFYPKDAAPTKFTLAVVKCAIYTNAVLSILISLTINFFISANINLMGTLLFLEILLFILLCVVISRQPETQLKIPFKVPVVILIGTLSIFINIFLMVKLSLTTWIRFGVWMIIGFFLYFSYGLWNSTADDQTEPAKVTQALAVEDEPLPALQLSESSKLIQ